MIIENKRVIKIYNSVWTIRLDKYSTFSNPNKFIFLILKKFYFCLIHSSILKIRNTKY